MRVTITDLDQPDRDIEQGVADAEDVELLMIDGGKDAGLDERVKGTDGLIVQYADVTAEVMDYLLPELKVIGRYGVGVDTIDLDAAKERGIRVVNVPDYGTQSVADHAITLALAVVRNLVKLEEIVRGGSMTVAPAAPIPQFDMLTFGVYGFGAIGRAVAEKARGVGFNVVATDAMLEPGTEVAGFPIISSDELLATADVISAHIPLIDATHHLFNDDAFAKMKDGSFFVNTARGGIADTEAIIRAVKSGKLAGAGLDVFESEPIPADSELLTLERVILTPHAAFYNEHSYAELKRRVVQNTIDVLKGRECANIVV